MFEIPATSFHAVYTVGVDHFAAWLPRLNEALGVL